MYLDRTIDVVREKEREAQFLFMQLTSRLCISVWNAIPIWIRGQY